MKIGMLGTGIVGNTLGSALVARGHQVRMGARDAASPKAAEWAAGAGAGASAGSFADAAAFGEVVVNATAGVASLDALAMAGADNLAGKVLIDVSNPLDFSKGMPPSLTICNTDSLGESIQRAFPATRVVKALNTLNCSLMVDPAQVPGPHHVFICGDDAAARAQVAAWLGEWFGWPAASVIDLGDMTGARGTEMVLPLWVRLMVTLGTANFNWHIAMAPKGAPVAAGGG